MSDADYAVFVERIEQHMMKALREAKVHASWVHPNPAYEAALSRFVGRGSSIGPSRHDLHRGASAA